MPDYPITANDRYATASASAAQTVFNADFPLLTAEELIVRRTRAGVTTTLALTTNYTVSGLDQQAGFTVTLTAGALAGDFLEFIGATLQERQSDFPASQALQTQALNADLDRALMRAQEVKRDADRVTARVDQIDEDFGGIAEAHAEAVAAAAAAALSQTAAAGSAGAAAASAGAASASAGAAAGSASAASTHAGNAAASSAAAGTAETNAEAAEASAEAVLATITAMGIFVLSGAGAPDNGDGEDGWFYIDRSAFDLYGPKTAGVWGTGVPMTAVSGGDVVGPSGGVVDNEIPLYSGGTGKLVKGSGVLLSSLATDAEVTAAVATKQNSDATLTALAGYNTNGLVTQTAADMFTGRTITGTANQVTVNNGSGVLGNPTLSLPQDIATSSSPQFSGIELGHASDTTLTRPSGGNIAIEGNIVYRAGGTDVPVADGGTGVSSLTAYAVMCGGTTGTGAVQSIAGVGTSGQVLTSNGAGALPTFQNAAGGSVASQADMEGASSTSALVTPGRQHFHPAHPKVWAFVTVSTGTPTLQTSYNVTSITDDGVGELIVTIATDFSSANWCSLGMAGSTSDELLVQYDAKAAGTISLEARNDTGALVDPAAWNFLGVGDQA